MLRYREGLLLALQALVVLLPAWFIAASWPNTWCALLPGLAVLLLVVYRLVESGGVGGGWSWPLAVSLTAVVSWPVVLAWPAPVSWALLVPAGLALMLWQTGARGGWGNPHSTIRLSCLALWALCCLFGASRELEHSHLVVSPEDEIGVVAQADDRDDAPLMFIPLDVAPGGQRVVLWSLRDRHGDDEEDSPVSLWDLELDDGQVMMIHRGYPFLTVDWAPSGEELTFAASDRSWMVQPEPFGVHAAAACGAEHRVPLKAPADGTSWMYPLWSHQRDLLGAWLLPEVPDFSDFAVTPAMEVPRSFVVSAAGGQRREITVPNCRLALLGAWQADAAGVYVITERGIFAVGPDRKPRRLVPGGEAPLDPFPFVIPDCVAPAGGNLAWLDLTFGGDGIKRIDLGVVDQRGKRRMVVKDLYPMAMAWSHDGKHLAGVRVGPGERVELVLYDAANGRRKIIQTGLKLADRAYPVRCQFSPNGEYLVLDGQFESPESWSIAMHQVSSGKTRLLEPLRNAFAFGWRADNKLVVGSLGLVAVANPDGSGIEQIYPRPTSGAVKFDAPSVADVAALVRPLIANDGLHWLVEAQQRGLIEAIRR